MYLKSRVYLDGYSHVLIVELIWSSSTAHLAGSSFSDGRNATKRRSVDWRYRPGARTQQQHAREHMFLFTSKAYLHLASPGVI